MFTLIKGSKVVFSWPKAVLSLALVGGVALSNAQSPPTLYWNDDFTSLANSSTLWDTTQMLQGARWNPPNINDQHNVAGIWQTFSSSSTGVTFKDGLMTMQSGAGGGGGTGPGPVEPDPPIVGGMDNASIARSAMAWIKEPKTLFSNAYETPYSLPEITPAILKTPQGVGNRIYPYIWAGGPQKPSPIPPTGNFTVHISYAVPALMPDGAGMNIRFWSNATPSGTNIPMPTNEKVFSAWCDTYGIRMILLNRPTVTTSTSATGVHIYKLVCTTVTGGQKYQIYLDGVLKDEITSPTTLRPNCIWLGNCVYNWWSGGPMWVQTVWDYVRVTVP